MLPFESAAISWIRHGREVCSLLGILSPVSGTCIRGASGESVASGDELCLRLFGRDPRQASARLEVGVALQASAFPTTLRVRELVAFVQAHYPSSLPRGELPAGFGLQALADRQLGGLSGGEGRRVAVALAFAGRPKLVVLDEPTAGLDGDSRRAVWAAVRAHAAAGNSVLLTTHYLEEAEALAGRVVLLAAGVVAADESVAALKASAGLTRGGPTS